MSKQRMVNTKFWTDRFVYESWDWKHKLVFLYLLTNDSTNIAGIYELSLVKASLEIGLDIKELEKILKGLEPKAYYLGEFVYLPKFLEHQGNNPKINMGVSQTVKSLPRNVKEQIEEIGIESERLLNAFKGSLTVFDNSNSNFNSNSNLKNKDNKAEVQKNIQLVYAFFIDKFERNPQQYKLSPQRKAKLQARMKDAGLEMLMKAVANVANSPFHMGDNERGWKADLDFIIRSYEQVERLSNLDKQNKQTEFSIYDQPEEKKR